jgi:AraC-like DNA-binding protein
VSWAGQFLFGRGWAVFRGQSADNSLHAHATVQLMLAGEGDIRIAGDDGRTVAGGALLVRPGVRHALAATPRATLIQLEPQTALARLALDASGPAPIGLLAPVLAEAIDAEASLDKVLDGLRALALEAEAVLDPRLASALAFLAEVPAGDAVARAASGAGLSVSRLRALAQAQLGVSLSTWLMWRKLERAGQALADGAPLAQAALAGDFADQAHFSRTMRRAFGITPRTAGAVVDRTQAKGSRPGRG